MPPSSVRIRAVLFDLGGTLVDERDFVAWADLARELYVDLEPDDLAHAYAEVERTDDVDPAAFGGMARVVEFWRRVLSLATGRAIEPATAERFVDRARSAQAGRSLPVFSDVRRCLDALRAEHRRLGIVSNSSSEANVRRILDQAGILDAFERIVSSGTEGVAKPDPEIFRRAVGRLGVRPDEALYVGNLVRTDAEAAARAGLHAAWLNRAGTGLGEVPNEITSLLEVRLVVRALEAAPAGVPSGARSSR